MKKIVVTFRVEAEQKKLIESLIDNAEIKYLKDYNKDEYLAILKDADALLAWNPSRELYSYKLNSLTNIRFVQLLSAGYDHIDFEMFPPDCKIVSNNGAYAEPMAEHIMAMILSLAKKLFINQKKLSDGEFNQRGVNISIKNSVFGILGFGGIGKAAANLIRPFGSKIYAINSSGKTNEAVDFIGTLEDLNFLLRKSDIIIISIPLTDMTKNLIGKKELELMKPDTILVNAARGQIINEADLYKHLKTHPEFCAGIDAWWTEPFTEGKFKLNYPFFDLPNFLGSPHNSAIVPDSLMTGLRKAVENINLYLNDNKPLHIVN
jgi:phosphoglycerate dehydrogenase-like enzyme